MSYSTEDINKTYKQSLIKLFKEFIRICDLHKLQYFCIGGTLIGALRHGGMIPWDDDIDIAMPRPDYDRFIALMSANQDGLEIIRMENSAHYYLPFAKICDTQSTILEYADIPCLLGLFIDIFPLDGAHADMEVRERDLLQFRRKANQLLVQPKYVVDNLLSGVKRLFKGQLRTALNEFNYAFGKENKRKALIADLNGIMKKYPYDSSEIIGNYGGMWGIKEFWRKEWFSDYSLCAFEGVQIRIPIGYDAILKQVYGNYMQLPPIENQVSHHNVAFMDLSKRLDLNQVLQNIKNK